MLKSILTSDISIMVTFRIECDQEQVRIDVVPAFIYYSNAKINPFFLILIYINLYILIINSNLESRIATIMYSLRYANSLRGMLDDEARGYVRYATFRDVVDHHRSSAKFIIST